MTEEVAGPFLSTVTVGTFGMGVGKDCRGEIRKNSLLIAERPVFFS